MTLIETLKAARDALSNGYQYLPLDGELCQEYARAATDLRAHIARLESPESLEAVANALDPDVHTQIVEFLRDARIKRNRHWAKAAIAAVMGESK